MPRELVHVALKEHIGDCEPLEALQGTLVPGLDVDTCVLEWLDDHRAAVEVGFSLVLVRQADEAIVCDLSATWRLVYRFDDRPTNERDFAATRAVHDAWPSWKAWLEATMAWMGLNHLRLAPNPPPGLVDLAREAYDLGVSPGT